jgi:uncharacterized membrane protein YqgA involved in biofilm formation
VIGLGTIVNVVAILVGSAIGVALGHRLPQRTRDVVTDGLGLITLLVAALSAAAVLDPSVREAVGATGVLIILASVLVGGIVGSLLQLEARLEGLGHSLQRRLGNGPTDVEVDGTLAAPEPGTAPRASFVDGFVTASLVFCVGPLAVLGSLSDGLGLGIEQLALKSVMDGFASIAFAASLGWGVAASALTVGIYQGTLTLVGWGLGSVLTDAQVALLTATGGLLLVGISLRLLRIRQVPVGDLLPALLVAPLLTALVAALR